MLYKIKWLEKKNNDWIVASLIEGASVGGNSPAEYPEVSINRVNKKGEVFPNFDDLQAGRDVEGELWTSDKGKHYLFAPRKGKTGGNSAFKSKVIEEAQTRKRTDIEHFQTSKEESIKMASAQRDAVLIVTTMLPNYPAGTTESEIKEDIIKWRNWFLLDKEFNNPAPF